MILRALKVKSVQLGWLLVASMLVFSGCQWENSEQTSLHVSVGYQSESARFANRASISAVYPSIGTIWVSIETPTLNVAQINEQYNNGQLTLNTAKSAIKITDTNVSLNVPTDETLTVSIEAFNIANLKVFSGSTEVTPEELGGTSVQVNVPIQADIDASVDILSYNTQCEDSDQDGFCNIFEDLFVNANGLPDIDYDGRYNSNDNDSDGDGVLDGIDHNEAELELGYTISNNGFPMFLVPNRAPIVEDINVSLVGAIEHIIQLPVSSAIDADVNDAITYEIVNSSLLDAFTEISGNAMTYSLLQGLVTTVTDEITIKATDLAGASKTFKVNITLAPSGLLNIL